MEAFSESWLLSFDKCPAAESDEFELLVQKTLNRHHGCHDGWERRRAENVDEHAIPQLVAVVGGHMQQRIVENKELIVTPVVNLVANNDVGGFILEVVDVVQNANETYAYLSRPRYSDPSLHHFPKAIPLIRSGVVSIVSSTGNFSGG